MSIVHYVIELRFMFDWLDKTLAKQADFNNENGNTPFRSDFANLAARCATD